MMSVGEREMDMAKNNAAAEREAKEQYIRESMDELDDKEIEDLAEWVHNMMARK